MPDLRDYFEYPPHEDDLTKEDGTRKDFNEFLDSSNLDDNQLQWANSDFQELIQSAIDYPGEVN